ncbi:MAG: flagellar motor protein MotB [Oligoflexales bacterium]
MIKHWLLVIPICLISACVTSGTYNDLERKYKDTYLKLRKEQLKNDHLNGMIQNNAKELNHLKNGYNSKEEQIALLKRDLEFANQYMEQNKVYADKIKRALAMEGLAVSLEDDRLLVKLPGDVLFPSGSASLSKQGLEHIARLGEILRTMDQRKIQVEGHTDNVPINGGRYDSNWYLGYDRAMSVLKLLVNRGVNQSLVSAASYGENKPIASNVTRQGKQLNRRIEVLIIPNLEPLKDFIEPNQPQLD